MKELYDEFTITPDNPPASEQDPAQAPDRADLGQRAITQQIPSTITQQIPSTITLQIP
jgi:hypothetical protein